MKNALGLVLLRMRIGGAWLPVVFLLATAATTLALQSGDFTYTTDFIGNVTITGYTGTDSAVDIPATIDGKTVVSIGDNVFMSGGGGWPPAPYSGNTNVTSVTIPDVFHMV